MVVGLSATGYEVNPRQKWMTRVHKNGIYSLIQPKVPNHLYLIIIFCHTGGTECRFCLVCMNYPNNIPYGFMVYVFTVHYS